jgi:hypothetical protein
VDKETPLLLLGIKPSSSASIQQLLGLYHDSVHSYSENQSNKIYVEALMINPYVACIKLEISTNVKRS